MPPIGPYRQPEFVRSGQTISADGYNALIAAALRSGSLTVRDSGVSGRSGAGTSSVNFDRRVPRTFGSWSLEVVPAVITATHGTTDDMPERAGLVTYSAQPIGKTATASLNNKRPVYGRPVRTEGVPIEEQAKVYAAKPGDACFIIRRLAADSDGIVVRVAELCVLTEHVYRRVCGTNPVPPSP